MPGPPKQEPQNSKTSLEFSSPEFLPRASLAAADINEGPCPETLVDYVSQTVLADLPNDLTRMIYLASLRDCNSGMYLHPALSQERGVYAADRGLRACHEQVFRRLLTTRLPDYVSQLQEYIRYTRSEVPTVLKTWKSLQAYRATAPVGALPASAELYCLNIAIALEVVSRETPGDR